MNRAKRAEMMATLNSCLATLLPQADSLRSELHGLHAERATLYDKCVESGCVNAGVMTETEKRIVVRSFEYAHLELTIREIQSCAIAVRTDETAN